jgi:hypothetical protein
MKRYARWVESFHAQLDATTAKLDFQPGRMQSRPAVVKEVDHRIWVVSFMDYDRGYRDPVDSTSSVTHVVGTIRSL